MDHDVLRMSFFCLLIISSISYLVEGQFMVFQDETPEIIKDSQTVTKEWEQMESQIKNRVNQGVKLLMPVLMDNMDGINISSSCVKQAMLIIGGIQKLKPWAFRFIDSSAKSIDGIMTGTVSSFGAYEECVDTVVINEKSGKHKGEVMFTGKYCTVRIKTSLPPRKPHYKMGEVMDELQTIYKKGTMLSQGAMYAHFLYDFPIRLGICIPSGCSVEDINQVLAKVSKSRNLYMNVRRCEVKEEVKFTPLMISVMFMYSFAGFMVLLGTLIDLYFYYSEKKPNSTSIRVLLAFSFKSNFLKFKDTSTSSKHLSCLNGIRFLTLSWIILSHSYVMGVFQLLSGLLYVQRMAQEFPFQVVMNTFVAVDTFFVMGGLLVCYVSTKHVIIAKRSFSLKKYIIHRLWRILPVYVFVILFVFLGEIVVSGPTAHTIISPFVERCKKNWWTNILFINNFYEMDNMCLPYTYYLSVDMQFYITSLVILLPLFRWPKIGMSVAVFWIISSIVVSGVTTYIRNLSPTFILANPNLRDISDLAEFYMKPYPHAGPYAIGMLTGYLLAVKQNIKIPKVIQLFGWCCSIVIGILVVYGSYEWNLGREPTRWESAFYSGFHKVAWSLCIAWIIVCCANGHGGIVNYILSWKIWIPLGRLSYIAYLVHYMVQSGLTASFHTPVHPRHSIGVWVFFGHLMTTYGIAFAGSMLIESPCFSLEKLFLSPNDEDKHKTSEKKSNHALDDVQVNKRSDPEFLSRNSNVSETGNCHENSGFVYRL